MDSIDRITPVVPTPSSVNLRVSEPNKDGGHPKHPGEQEDREQPHDVLELHSEDGGVSQIEVAESSDPPTIGLDLAV